MLIKTAAPAVMRQTPASNRVARRQYRSRFQSTSRHAVTIKRPANADFGTYWPRGAKAISAPATAVAATIPENRLTAPAW